MTPLYRFRLPLVCLTLMGFILLTGLFVHGYFA